MTGQRHRRFRFWDGCLGRPAHARPAHTAPGVFPASCGHPKRPMNPHEISLVKTSFAKVTPIAEQAAALFYTRLFELDPALRALFQGGDMAEQGRKLMQMFSLAVNGLDRIETLAP